MELASGQVASPAFLPDGQFVAFYSEGLKKIAIAGGAAVTLCKMTAPYSGPDWHPSGLVFAQTSGVMRVSADGGEPVKGLDMWLACTHAGHMSKMVQVRNVPDTLHRKLKMRAAGSGQTLSDYLLAELGRLAARPTREEMLATLHSRTRVTLKTSAAAVIREERESA